VVSLQQIGVHAVSCNGFLVRRFFAVEPNPRLIRSPADGPFIYDP